MDSILGELFWLKNHRNENVVRKLSEANSIPSAIINKLDSVSQSLMKEKECITFCNPREKTEYMEIKKTITGDQPYVSQTIINKMLAHILNDRVPYKRIFTFRLIVTQLFRLILPCCFKRRSQLGIEDYKVRNLYEHGVRRYYNELDVINIIKAIRVTKLLKWHTLHKRQRVLLHL